MKVVRREFIFNEQFPNWFKLVINNKIEEFLYSNYAFSGSCISQTTWVEGLVSFREFFQEQSLSNQLRLLSHLYLVLSNLTDKFVDLNKIKLDLDSLWIDSELNIRILFSCGENHLDDELRSLIGDLSNKNFADERKNKVYGIVETLIDKNISFYVKALECSTFANKVDKLNLD